MTRRQPFQPGCKSGYIYDHDPLKNVGAVPIQGACETVLITTVLIFRKLEI